MFLDCRAMVMLTISERREYIKLYIVSWFNGRDTNYLSFQHDESLKKIGGMVPEIFDVFSFHATYLPPEERKLSCAATFSTFPVTPHNFYRI